MPWTSARKQAAVTRISRSGDKGPPWKRRDDLRACLTNPRSPPTPFHPLEPTAQPAVPQVRPVLGAKVLAGFGIALRRCAAPWARRSSFRFPGASAGHPLGATWASWLRFFCCCPRKRGELEAVSSNALRQTFAMPWRSPRDASRCPRGPGWAWSPTLRMHAAGSLSMRRAAGRAATPELREHGHLRQDRFGKLVPGDALRCRGLKTLIVSRAVTVWQRSKSWLSTAKSSGGRSASTMVATGPAGSQELPQDRVLQIGIAMAFAPSRRPPWIIAIEPISPGSIRGGSSSATASSHSPPPLGPRLLQRSAPSGSSSNRVCAKRPCAAKRGCRP